MGLRIVMVWWVVIRLLLRLMWIIRCGASMAAARRLIRLWPVAWVVLACWALARWVCVVRLVWGRVPWVLLAAWVLPGCAAWVARVLPGCVVWVARVLLGCVA